MAEEPETIQTPGPAQGQERRRQRSVLQYIVILFAAAFVLLLVTFMMERRQYEQQQQESQASIDDLQQQSVSAYQTLQGMIEENNQLKEQLEDQEKQLEDLQGRFDQLEADYNAAEQANIWQGRTAEAMDWFWQINEAYVLKKYTLCRSLIDEMGEELAAYFPDYSVTDTDSLSPAERYQEIYDRIIK